MKKNTLMKNIQNSVFLLIFLTSVISIPGCSGVNNAVKNVQRLQFKLGPVDGFNLDGIKIKNMNSINDLNILDGAKLLSSFASGKLPATFTVNLIAKNPDYAGGSKESSSIIKSLDWRLLIDDKEMLTGAIDKGITIPGVGQSVTIPIPVTIDFFKLLGDGGYESLINLALAIGGKTGNSSKITLKVDPTLDMFLGGIISPGEIDVVSKEFR